MARKSKGKFNMKGHTLPGINQKSETKNAADGRSASSPFQHNDPSPNKFLGGALKTMGKVMNPMTGGPGGAIMRGITSGFGQGQTTPQPQQQSIIQANLAKAGISPFQAKLEQTGSRKTVGGELGGNLYKTSPLNQGEEQDTVQEGAEETIPGQYLEQVGENEYKDVDSGEVFKDVKGVVTVIDGNVEDNDYIIEGENIIGVHQGENAPGRNLSQGQQGQPAPPIPPVTPQDLK